VKSYLQIKSFFRYELPDQIPANQQLVYLPYWRFKGMLFSCVPRKIQHQFVDVSLPAIQSHLFPNTLGFRSQVLKLRFSRPAPPARYLQHNLSYKAVMQKLRERYKPRDSRHLLHQAFIGDTVSMIYAPFYVDKYLYDGVLNEPISPELPNDFNLHSFPEAKPVSGIHFLATLCPYCGWDLEGQRDSLLLHCTNCTSVYQPEDRGFSKLTAGYMPGPGEPQVYMPFWRIKADISGLQLATYTDLVREANLPKVVPPGFAEVPFHFWNPAFKIRPQFLLRLSQNITASQPAGPFQTGIPKGNLHQVNLPLTEGIESLKLVLAGIIKPRSKIESILSDIQVKPLSYILVYLPFVEKHHDKYN
jgi:hypothetical protein